MTNLFSYLNDWGNRSFRELPWGEVDALIAAKISYFPWNGIVPEDFSRTISLGQAAGELLENKLTAAQMEDSRDHKLLSALMKSRRFSPLPLCGFVSRTDDGMQKQFAALCLRAGKKVVLNFRGTDDTLVGWKENFNMSFSAGVPSQMEAARYVNTAAEQLRGELAPCGHSKGGNLAVYSGAFCAPAHQERIKEIWNFDGPGFIKKVTEKQGYKAVSGRIRSYVPESSVVGLLLEQGEDYTVVKSSQSGLLQHDPYSWEVEGTRFAALRSVTPASRLLDETMGDWLAQLSLEEREQFVEILYSVLEKTGAKTVSELSDKWYQTAASVLFSLHGLDGEMKKAVLYALWALIKSAAVNFLEEL